MGSAWDTYYDRDPASDWCSKHNKSAYHGCTDCEKERSVERKAYANQAKDILKAAGFDTTKVSFWT